MRSETHQLLDVRVKCESLRHDCPCFGSTSTPTIQRFVEQFTSIELWTRAVARGLLERDWETEQKQRSPHVPQKPSLESKDVTTQNKTSREPQLKASSRRSFSSFSGVRERQNLSRWCCEALPQSTSSMDTATRRPRIDGSVLFDGNLPRDPMQHHRTFPLQSIL